jgi:hypothetical protein
VGANLALKNSEMVSSTVLIVTINGSVPWPEEERE